MFSKQEINHNKSVKSKNQNHLTRQWDEGEPERTPKICSSIKAMSQPTSKKGQINLRCFIPTWNNLNIVYFRKTLDPGKRCNAVVFKICINFTSLSQIDRSLGNHQLCNYESVKTCSLATTIHIAEQN